MKYSNFRMWEILSHFSRMKVEPDIAFWLISRDLMVSSSSGVKSEICGGGGGMGSVWAWFMLAFDLFRGIALFCPLSCRLPFCMAIS